MSEYDRFENLMNVDWVAKAQSLERQLSEARKELVDAKNKAKVMFDLHDALGVRWGDDPYFRIRKLKESESQLTAYQSAFGKVREYVDHADTCIRSHYNAGRPTADGGYEVQYGDKWYQSRPIDQTPKCQCGLDEALTLLSTLNAQDAPQPGQGGSK